MINIISGKNKYILIASIVIIAFIIYFMSYNPLPCEQVNEAYLITSNNENKHNKITCSNLPESLTNNFNVNESPNLTQSGDSLNLNTPKDIIAIDKQTLTSTTVTNIVKDGIIHAVALYNDTEKLYFINSGSTASAYNSYAMYNNIKIQSQGGLITSGMVYNDYIFLIERMVPKSDRVLSKYDKQGNFIKSFDPKTYTGFGDHELTLQSDGQLFSYFGNMISTIDSNDQITTHIPHLLKDEFIAYAKHQEDHYLIISNLGNIYQFQPQNRTSTKINVLKDNEKDMFNIDSCYTTSDDNNIVCKSWFNTNMTTNSNFFTYDIKDNNPTYYYEHLYDNTYDNHPQLLIKK